MNKDLFNEGYGKNFKEHLIEQYKTYVASGEAISKKREASNKFYLSLNSALAIIAGFISSQNPTGTYLLVFAGILMSCIWTLNIKSYKALSDGVYRVLQEIEKELPARIYEYEHELLETDRRINYRKLTNVEQYVPYVMILFYITVLILAVTKTNFI